MAAYDVYARSGGGGGRGGGGGGGGYDDGGYYEDREYKSERSRWTPLTRMLLSGEMTQEKQKELSNTEKFGRWMINEGYRRM